MCANGSATSCAHFRAARHCGAANSRVITKGGGKNGSAAESPARRAARYSKLSPSAENVIHTYARCSAKKRIVLHTIALNAKRRSSSTVSFKLRRGNGNKSVTSDTELQFIDSSRNRRSAKENAILIESKASATMAASPASPPAIFCAAPAANARYFSTSSSSSLSLICAASSRASPTDPGRYGFSSSTPSSAFAFSTSMLSGGKAKLTALLPLCCSTAQRSAPVMPSPVPHRPSATSSSFCAYCESASTASEPAGTAIFDSWSLSSVASAAATYSEQLMPVSSDKRAAAASIEAMFARLSSTALSCASCSFSAINAWWFGLLFTASTTNDDASATPETTSWPIPMAKTEVNVSMTAPQAIMVSAAEPAAAPTARKMTRILSSRNARNTARTTPDSSAKNSPARTGRSTRSSR
mmetsp:Transcript_9039/g.23738  ORF Transcript_9039/g.23738 Transcript_9039/m.23738 type:complete len:413 (+) Transcript_9039:549-1787(+)